MGKKGGKSKLTLWGGFSKRGKAKEGKMFVLTKFLQRSGGREKRKKTEEDAGEHSRGGGKRGEGKNLYHSRSGVLGEGEKKTISVVDAL